MRTVYCASCIALLALLMVLPGCGGGGGAAPAPVLTPPSISNLLISPLSVLSTNPTPSMTIVDGSIDFSDAGGDVVQVEVFVFNGSTLISSTTTPVLLTAFAVTSGILGFTVNVETTLPVTYTIQVDVVDSGGSVSNSLSRTFSVL